MTYHHIIMFLAGVGVPTLAAMNAQLGREIGSPALAATVLFSIACLCAAGVAWVTGANISKLALAPKHLFFAGCLIAFYLLSVTWIAPIIGLGSAIFLVLIGQLVAAALIDQFGLFGATQIQINWTRAAGLALMASGILLIQKA